MQVFWRLRKRLAFRRKTAHLCGQETSQIVVPGVRVLPSRCPLMMPLNIEQQIFLRMMPFAAVTFVIPFCLPAVEADPFNGM